MTVQRMSVFLWLRLQCRQSSARKDTSTPSQAKSLAASHVRWDFIRYVLMLVAGLNFGDRERERAREVCVCGVGWGG